MHSSKKLIASTTSAIKNLMKIINERTRIKRLVIDKKIYLSPGRYKIIGRGQRIIYLANSDEIRFIEANTTHQLRGRHQRRDVKSAFKKIIAGIPKINIEADQESSFQGTLLMFGRGKNIKIFNFKNQVILCFLKDKNDYIKIKKAYEKFNKYLSIPKMQFFDENQLMYTEEYIDFVPYNLWTIDEKQNIINLIAEKYCAYFHNSYKDAELVSVKSLIYKFKQYIAHKDLDAKIDEILDKNHTGNDTFPVIPLHGDLIFNNILYMDGEYFVIDWDNYGEYIFFYDFLNLIFAEYIFQNNITYFNSFINGEYDKHFSCLFSAIGIEFDASKKQFYSALYFMERFIKLLQSEENKNKLQGFFSKTQSILLKMDDIEY